MMSKVTPLGVFDMMLESELKGQSEAKDYLESLRFNLAEELRSTHYLPLFDWVLINEVQD